MNLLVVDDEVELGLVVAAEVAKVMALVEYATLGLATGSTPQPAYRELIRMCQNGDLSFENNTAFLLDEYFGLPRTHYESFAATIQRDFVHGVNFPDGAVKCLDGMTDNAAATCLDYEHAIQAAGGIDVQLLGIGRNGHIAFNEPGSPLDSRTRMVELTNQTRDVNGCDDFEEFHPTHALTMGVGTIIEGRRLILMASGPAKADAVAAALEGPVTPDCPASVVQTHDNIMVVLDKAAASKLSQ